MIATCMHATPCRVRCADEIERFVTSCRPTTRRRDRAPTDARAAVREAGNPLAPADGPQRANARASTREEGTTMDRKSFSTRALIMLAGVAALAAGGCATERAAARTARTEPAPVVRAPAGAPVVISIKEIPGQPAASPRVAPAPAATAQAPAAAPAGAAADLTSVVEAPVPTAAVQVPRTRIRIEPQAPRIVVNQQPPEIILGDMPQPQVYLQGREGAGAPATPGAEGDLTKVIQAPAPTVTVDVPRPRIVIRPEPARVIVNQQPPEIVLEEMPAPQVTTGPGTIPAASPKMNQGTGTSQK
jgi:hypothetical protein